MVSRRAVITVVGLAVLGVPLPRALAQVDPAAMIGKWEGRLQEARGDPGRTLTLEGVREQEGRWVAAGHFGVTGRRLVPVEIAVTPRPSDAILEFAISTPGGPQRIRLVFRGSDVMHGTAVTPGAAGARQEMNLRLERAGPAKARGAAPIRDLRIQAGLLR